MPASPTDSTSSSSSAARDRAATEAAATEAGPPADTTASDASSATATGSAKRATAAPTCPTCRGALERYAGAAAHKLGSFWCHACGVRHRLPASAAADEGAPLAPGSTSGTKAAGAG